MMLCIDYELLTKIQAIRIDIHLPRIIDSDERGFMKDFYIVQIF